MEKALYQAAILTFEELGFLFPVIDSGESKMSEKNCVNVTVGFDGDMTGKLVLEVESKFLPTIAANMLGEDEVHGEELLHDVLGEIANVICGNALPAIAGKQALFRLAPPKVNGENSEIEMPSALARLDLDESIAEVSIYIN